MKRIGPVASFVFVNCFCSARTKWTIAPQSGVYVPNPIEGGAMNTTTKTATLSTWLGLIVALFATASPVSAGAAGTPLQGDPGFGPAIAAAQEKWSQASQLSNTYTATYRWTCPSSPGLPCLGVGSAPFDDIVSVDVLDGEIVGADADSAVTIDELFVLLAQHSLELDAAVFDAAYGYPVSFEFGAPLCLGPPATPDSPGGCPGAPQGLSFELVSFDWGLIDADQVARFNLQLEHWDLARPQNYSFDLRYSSFFLPTSGRIVVNDGVASLAPSFVTAPDGEPQIEPVTIDALMEIVQRAVSSRSLVGPVGYDSDHGFATTLSVMTADPLIADGFFGFEITNFISHDGLAADHEAASDRWSTHMPYSYVFEYQRWCFCPPPFGPVTLFVDDDEVIGVLTSETDVGNQEFPTISELLDTAPAAPQGGTIAVTYDSAWGFPASLSSQGPPGLADAGFSSAITNFVPDNDQFTCGGQTPTMVGTDGDDVLVGTSGVDVIFGGRGDDQIYGLGGDDFLCGGGGADLLSGGEGNDYVSGDYGADELHGLVGDDVLEGGLGDDRIRGQSGNDRLVGGPGDDDLFGARGNDTVYGESGDDRVRGGTGDDLVDGGPGDDFVSGNGGLDTVMGGDGIDELVGGPRPDVLDGGAGNDLLRGRGGADQLRGGAGDDELRGNLQSDQRFDGGTGTDVCNGGDGIEALAGTINCEILVAIP